MSLQWRWLWISLIDENLSKNHIVLSLQMVENYDCTQPLRQVIVFEVNFYELHSRKRTLQFILHLSFT